MSTPRKKLITQFTSRDETLDAADTAYRAEYDRWCWRRSIIAGSYRFELVRNSSPNNDINADEYFEITTLTKRECRDRHEAEAWLGTYRGRAAMRAALETL